MATYQIIREEIVPVKPPIKKIVLELSPEELILIKVLTGRMYNMICGGVLNKVNSDLYFSLPNFHNHLKLLDKSDVCKLKEINKEELQEMVASIK